MTFRINNSHEDFSGLTRFGFSILRVEKRYLSLIQQDNYRQRVEIASKFCSKLGNLRFSFMRNFSAISDVSKYPVRH
jgi:hypothetical protein